MFEDRTAPESEEFAELRELLLGRERRELEQLRQELDAKTVTPEELAERLPEAIALRGGRDKRLARALAPTIDDAIAESVRLNPREIASAIFPVLGPAIRRAIAEALAGLVQSVNRALEHGLSLRGLQWRVEAWQTGVPYAQVVLRHALIYRVEQLFLIHAETGLLLAHVAPPELKVQNADLISGMLTAIQDFVGDSFGEQEAGGLRAFSVGELTVMVAQGPRAVLAAAVRGQPPDSLLGRLMDTLETIHLRYAAPLADFTGDSASFAAAQELLEDRLETVLTTDREDRQRSRATWLRWALPLVALVLVPGALLVQSGRRWQRAVDRLEAEPGILVVDAERSGGRWRFRGFRDPLAGNPALVLAGLGVDTSRVEGRWEPFLSLEPALVVARARRELGAPGEVQLSLHNDSLVGAGRAPVDWLGRMARLSALPAGIAGLNLSAVAGVLAADLDQLRGGIESRPVLFDAGSATLGPAMRPLLQQLADSLARLRRALAGSGYRATVTLEGRADATGTEAMNQMLSRLRTDVVSAALGRLGVPSAELETRPLGTADPLSAPDPAEQARLNRSVRLRLRIAPAGSGAP